MKLKSKIGYDDYYTYICSKFDSYQNQDRILLVERQITETLDDLVFNEYVIDRFIMFLKDMYYKGLWLNNFNNYSIRYDSFLDDFYVYDPDSFYVISHNKDLCGIKDINDFFEKFIKYKLREKSIIYRLKNNDLDKEAANYIYYSYWLLENVAQRLSNG